MTARHVVALTLATMVVVFALLLSIGAVVAFVATDSGLIVSISKRNGVTITLTRDTPSRPTSDPSILLRDQWRFNRMYACSVAGKNYEFVTDSCR